MRRQAGPRLLGTCLIGAGLLAAAGKAWAAPQQPRPQARILVGPLGFEPPARFYMPYHIPSVTLDFLDARDLLFTFHVPELMHREPGDPEGDQDQTIRALVLHVPDGKTLAEAEWRLHDRGRYLWTLADGHFVLRIKSTLMIGDSSLALHPYLEPEGTLVSVQSSPEAATLVTEYEVPGPPSLGDGGDGRPGGAPTLGPDAPHPSVSRAKRYTMLVVNTETHKATRFPDLPQAVEVPMVSGGYLSVRQDKGKTWSILLSPFGGAPSVIGTVSSPCQPMVQAISEHAFLTSSCLPYSSDHLIDAFDLEGHKLWEKVWQSRFIWGTYAFDETGTRFAYGSCEINRSLEVMDEIDSSAILGEPVGVFDTESGDLATVLGADPVLTAGQNFALSPDGKELAILRDGAIELYKLPPPPPASARTVAAGKAR